jgi:hypothetical protein
MLRHEVLLRLGSKLQESNFRLKTKYEALRLKTQFEVLYNFEKVIMVNNTTFYRNYSSCILEL